MSRPDDPHAEYRRQSAQHFEGLGGPSHTQPPMWTHATPPALAQPHNGWQAAPPPPPPPPPTQPPNAWPQQSGPAGPGQPSPSRALVLRPWHALWLATGIFLLFAVVSSSSLGWILLAVAAALGAAFLSQRARVREPATVSAPAGLPRTPLVPLRAMTIPELFTGTARIMARYWPALLGIPVAILVGFMLFVFLTATVIGQVIASMATSANGGMLVNPNNLMAGFLIVWLVYTFVIAAIAFPADALLIALSVVATDRAVRGWPVRPREVLRHARSRMFAVCRLTLVFYLITLAPDFLFMLIVTSSPSAAMLFATPGGMVLMIVVLFPFFFGVGLLLSLAPIAVVVEGRGVGTALKRSVQLLKPAFGRILGIHLLWSICMSVVLVVFFFVLGKQMVTDLFGNPLLGVGDLLLFAAVVGVMIGFFRVLQALIYTDVRIRQEGYDRELIDAWNRAPADGLTTNGSEAGKPMLLVAVGVAVLAVACLGAAWLSGPSDREIIEALRSTDSSSTMFNNGRPLFHVVDVSEAEPGWYVAWVKRDDMELETGTVILRTDQSLDGSLTVLMGPGTAFPCKELPESVGEKVTCFDGG
jgi:hypothetical protein